MPRGYKTGGVFTDRFRNGHARHNNLPVQWCRYIVALHRIPILHLSSRLVAAQNGVIAMQEFGRLVEAQIPRLRRYARALTRDVTRADDLVQSCLLRAVAKQHLWQPGTDLRAWLFTILHNQYVNDVRRSVREADTIELSEAPQLTVQSNAIASLELRDLETALGKLQPEQRE